MLNDTVSTTNLYKFEENPFASRAHVSASDLRAASQHTITTKEIHVRPPAQQFAHVSLKGRNSVY